MYVCMTNIAPIRTRKTEIAIASTEPVETEGGEFFKEDEEDVLGVGLDVEVAPVSRPETEFADTPEAPSNKLDPGLTSEEAVSPPETPLAVGVTETVTGI
jgi:hypothetical protein